ncbi:hypothetical protein H0A36_30780 [Endozoicomonas sp. SM1973]|uniref:Uncharacterized protein n=1 Tax=Spartinivicinus marinus TaxID=2994442 RepID=A0A853I928_9GAMM|nr:hypothetical protein [Spartinivicinus marinus]NYZ70400.1 hypothetical protein [Spartinivicinus marinus]
MEKINVLNENLRIKEEFGIFPHDFFRILLENDTHFDFDRENADWDYIKDETWHDLNMKDYVLWATTDNCDLLWWNGNRVIAMSPRSYQFMSLQISPLKFIKEIPRGTITGIFPNDLWNNND